MNFRRKKGIVLVIVLGLILLFVIAAGSFMLMSSTEIRMVRMQSDSTRALYLAEAGLEHVRVQLDQDWSDHTSLSNITLGEGTYSVNISEYESDGTTELPADELRVESTGNVNEASRTIEIMLKSLVGTGSGGANVDSPIETEGTLTILGSADINPEGGEEENVDLSFETIFGITKEDMEEIAQNNFPNTYYTTVFHNETATGLTWIDTPGIESQITTVGWTGDGILVIEGDMQITGGTFDGVIWVIGALLVSGNPTINGGIFVESGITVDTTVTGNATINFSASAVGDAFSYLTQLPPVIESWQEISN
jgi:hypothetical protein